MKKRPFRFLALLLALFLFVTPLLEGCSFPSGNTPGTKDSQEASAEHERFTEFCEDLFLEELTSNTINLHYSLAYPENYGISDYEPALPILSRADKDDDIRETKELLDELTAFDYDSLTEDDQLTYDVLKEYLKTALSSSPFYYYEEAFAPISGFQSSFSMVMAEYTFRREQDVTDYLGLLEQVPAYIKSLISFEKERAGQGFVMPAETISEVISGIRTFINSGDENIYLSSFEERIEGLSDLPENKKEEYIAKNASLVKEKILPAYQDIVRCLQGLSAKGTEAKGLCHIDGGNEYYAYLIKSLVGSGHTPEELITLLEDRLSTEITRMSALVMADPGLLDHFDGQIPEDRAPEEIIEYLKGQMADAYPELPVEASYQIKYVPDYMEDISSPAFYMTPPIDALNENTIYINESLTDESSLFSTLAHESYPGHLYQIVYSSAKLSNPLRKLLDYQGYSEGWGLYVEHESYALNDRLAGQSKSLAELYRINSSVTLAVHALADLKIHYEGCGTGEIAELISAYFGEMDDEFIESFYNTIVSEPGYYLKYYVGYLEFCLLREKAEAQLEETFDLKKFHTFILDMGPCAFTTLDAYLEPWIEAQKQK